MSNIIYTKTEKESINKNLVQEEMYKWLFSGKAFNNSEVLLLAGKYPQQCILRVKKYIKGNGAIHLYENNFGLYDFIKRNSLSKIKKALGVSRPIIFKNQNVRKAPNNIRVQDLDLCSTLFGNRTRAVYNNKLPTDAITIFQDRLHLQKQSVYGNEWRCMIGTITPRNGIGKPHNIECLNTLCFQLGWQIKSVDSLEREKGYDRKKARVVDGSGFHHKNGWTYLAYEHSVLLSPLPKSIDLFKDVRMKLFTYNDGQPMLTFGIAYRRKRT